MRPVPRLAPRLLGASLLAAAIGCSKAPAPVAPPPTPPVATSERTDPDASPESGPPAGPAADVLDPDQLMKRVEQVDDPAAQQALLERVIAQQPDHPQALRKLMDVSERVGLSLAVQPGRRSEADPHLMRAAEVARRLLESGEPLSSRDDQYIAMVIYNEACTLALADLPERALSSLREAIALGFDDPVILTDEDLDSLRDLPEFRDLLEEFSRRVQPGEEDEGMQPCSNVADP